jgi:phosphatidylethanolamine-binding protein (PEBP) family uncharacterized protein
MSAIGHASRARRRDQEAGTHRGCRPPFKLAGALVVLALAGCGSSSTPSAVTTQSTSASVSKESSTDTPSTATSSTTSASAREKVPNLDLSVNIPGLVQSAGGAVLPKRYTCDGAGLSPPISWGKVPAHTVEIDLFLTSIEHATEYTEWAVAGLSPHLHGISAGHLPSGAILGRNRDNKLSYMLCPRKGIITHYEVLYFPLPRKLPARPGFNAEALALEAVHTAPQEGQVFFTYKRS